MTLSEIKKIALEIVKGNGYNSGYVTVEKDGWVMWFENEPKPFRSWVTISDRWEMFKPNHGMPTLIPNWTECCWVIGGEA